MPDLKQVILDGVQETPLGCWEWIRYRLNTGYGAVYVGRKRRTTHRVAYETFVGPIPRGMLVCHHCDNRACCNPNHLFLGTHQDNMDDMSRKGRSTSPLSAEDVREIRRLVASGATQRKVAAQFGVHFTVVNKIVHRKTWRYI